MAGRCGMGIRSGILAGAIMLCALSAPAFAQSEETAAEPAPAFIVERYEAKAASGDARAMFRLGVLHERGLVTGTPDPVAAADWYGRAAEAGLAEGQFKRARMHEAGIGGPVDLTAAAELYRAAAGQGVAEAQFNLAVLLHTGRGVPRDFSEAIRWYEQAAFRGVVPAMRALGILYVGGVENTPQDAIEAWAWLMLAAENGDTDAAIRLPEVRRKLNAAAADEAMQLLDAYRQLRIRP